MSELKQIFRFGWPYLKRYWGRLIAGVLLGVLFGLSNASFIWATRTIFQRLGSKPPEIAVTSNAIITVSVSTNAAVAPQFTASAQGGDLKLSTDTEIKIVVATNVLVQVEGNTLRHRLHAFGMRFFDPIKRFGQAVDRFVDPWLPLRGRHPDWKQIFGGLMFMPILVFFRGYVGYLSSYCMAWVSERVIRDLRLDLLDKLNSLSMDYYNKSTMGDLLMRVKGDTEALYRCLSVGFSDLIKEPVTILGLVCGLLLLDWKLTLLALIFTPITIIPIRVLGKKVRDAITKSISIGTFQDSLLIEVYSNIRVIKAFNLESMQMKRFRAIYGNLVNIGMKSVKARELVNPLVEVISTLGLGVVIVFIVIGDVTVPSLIGFLTGVTLLFQPLKKLGGLHVYFQHAGVGANRLVQIFQVQPTVKEKPDALPFKEFTNELHFEKVSFGYRLKRPVVRDLTLSIPRGLKLGIAGESGSGKSTFVNLLFRFYDPTQGTVTIDGIDLRDLSVRDLRQQLALVSQEVVIFDQTVAENIACGREGATREEIEAAAKGAFAHEFIMQLPKGYETRVGEGGKTLSVGQRQRISIARAFVRNAPILVLDEATAALDAKAEAEVQAAVDRLSENRTVICIAHRLSTLAAMDKILVLKDGRVLEQGTYQELLRSGKSFAMMAKKQGITFEPL